MINISLGDTESVPQNFKVWLPPGTSDSLNFWETSMQYRSNWLTTKVCSTGVIDSQRKYGWIFSDDPLRQLLPIPCPILIAHGQMQQSRQEIGLVTRELDTLGMKIWIKPAKEGAKGQRKLEWLVEKGYNEYQFAETSYNGKYYHSYY